MLSILQAAGWPIVPLVLCSIVALALVIERFLSLRESRVAPPRLVDEVMSVTRTALPPADTLNKLAENSILGLVLAQGLRAASAEPRITEPNLRAAFESAGRDAVHRLERNLSALGTIASAAPGTCRAMSWACIRPMRPTPSTAMRTVIEGSPVLRAWARRRRLEPIGRSR